MNEEDLLNICYISVMLEPAFTSTDQNRSVHWHDRRRMYILISFSVVFALSVGATTALMKNMAPN